MQHWLAIKGPTKNAPHPQKCVHVHKAHNQETCLFIFLAKSNFKVLIISKKTVSAKFKDWLF